MNTRRKLIIIAVSILIIFVGAIYGITLLNSKNTASTPTISDVSTKKTDTLQPSVQPNAPLSPEETATKTPAEPLKPSESALIAIALPFVERLGSYSNQGGYENLQALLPFMTDSMKQWAQGKIDNAKTANFDPLYNGTTTSVVSYKVVSTNDADAELTMTTQRKQSVGTATNMKVYNQDVTVKMLKEAGVWLVDSVDWK